MAGFFEVSLNLMICGGVGVLKILRTLKKVSIMKVSSGGWFLGSFIEPNDLRGWGIFEDSLGFSRKLLQ